MSKELLISFLIRRNMIYQESGYLNIDFIISRHQPFTFVVGGRGTGKTYGALEYVIEHNIKFILLRRMQSQIDLINKPEFCPFKALNEDKGWNIGTQPLTKYNVGFYHMQENEQGKMIPCGQPLGYSMALSTISNLRGFDASDVKLLIFDEFIPERHERPIKNEGAAFMNAYETINRNRELKGLPPLQVLCLANANDLGNPIFMELKLISKAETMKRKGQEMSILSDKGIALFILNASPISDKKKGTALYKLTEGNEYSDMALGNNFAEMKGRNIRSMPISEFNPFISVGEITIYKHKSEGYYYISSHSSGDCPYFETSDMELKRLQMHYNFIWIAYFNNSVVCESSMCELIFIKYFSHT